MQLGVVWGVLVPAGLGDGSRDWDCRFQESRSGDELLFYALACQLKERGARSVAHFEGKAFGTEPDGF